MPEPNSDPRQRHDRRGVAGAIRTIAGRAREALIGFGLRLGRWLEPRVERLRAAGAGGRRRVRRLTYRARRSRAANTIATAWRSEAAWRLRRAAPGAVSGATFVALVGLTAMIGMATHYGQTVTDLPSAPDNCPSRVYAAPTEIRAGDVVDAESLAAELETLRYRVADERIVTGSYWRHEERLAVGLRTTRSRRGPHRPVRLDLVFEDDRIARLLVDGTPTQRPVTLDAPELAALPDSSLVDCIPTAVDRVPEQLVRAILAAEDDGFFDHDGIAPVGILRAAWVNLTNGRVTQGGSTLTQQLVKNVYLSSARTYTRKALEAILALAVESRHDKSTIITSYLNHAYLGRRGRWELVGVGAGARAWFGKEAGELALHESALLAAMIRSPGAYDPVQAPDRARARRDWVLGRMHRLGWIDEETHTDAIRRSLGIHQPDDRERLAPHFVDRVARETENRFGIDPAGAGLAIRTTLRLEDQRAAERAVAERRPETRDGTRLEAALVSLDSATGAVRAWVGGGDYAESVFDRVAQARRQVGSTFKPFVYATAIEAGTVRPGDQVYDAPLLIGYGDEHWLPRNNDREFRGPLPVHRALELSLNVPTVRVAVATGIDRIRDLASHLGLVQDRAEPIPSLALGTLEASPLQLARAYAAIAAGGMLPSPHTVAWVQDETGRILERPLPSPRQVLSPGTARTIRAMLREVVRRGTGAGLGRYGIRTPIAGKTGTSDDQRDAWFAGFDAERTTVAWVGSDDGSPVGYYGSEAALPIWGAFVSETPHAGRAPEWTDLRELLPESGAGADADMGIVRTSSGERSATDRILRPRRFDFTPRDLLWSSSEVVRRRGGRTVIRYNYPEHALDLEPEAIGRYEEPLPSDPWELFQARLQRWNTVSLPSDALRVFEVPTWFGLPCTGARVATIEHNPCADPARAGVAAAQH